jgi:hypothetical protein
MNMLNRRHTIMLVIATAVALVASIILSTSRFQSRRSNVAATGPKQQAVSTTVPGSTTTDPRRADDVGIELSIPSLMISSSDVTATCTIGNKSSHKLAVSKFELENMIRWAQFTTQNGTAVGWHPERIQRDQPPVQADYVTVAPNEILSIEVIVDKVHTSGIVNGMSSIYHLFGTLHVVIDDASNAPQEVSSTGTCIMNVPPK